MKKRLSDKEEEIMGFFWDNGDMFVREVVDNYPDPKPHFNTVATFVRGLEAKGFLTHQKIGNSYRYSAAVSPDAYGRATLPALVRRLFGGSGLNMVSMLVENEKIPADELRRLADMMEQERRERDG